MRKIFSVPIGILQPSNITEIMYLLCLVLFIRFQHKKGKCAPPKIKENVFKPYFHPKNSTIYDILPSIKIGVETIHKNNQKTMPFVWSGVFLAPLLCV